MANDTPLRQRAQRLGVDALGLVARMNHCMGLMTAPSPHVKTLAAELRAEADDLVRQLTGVIVYGNQRHPDPSPHVPAQAHTAVP